MPLDLWVGNNCIMCGCNGVAFPLATDKVETVMMTLYCPEEQLNQSHSCEMLTPQRKPIDVTLNDMFEMVSVQQ